MNYAKNTESTKQPNTIIIHLENNRKKIPIAYSIVTKEKHPWSNTEKEALLKGVEEHGEGKWQLILSSSNAFHPCRSSVDLKDKFRLLNRASSYYMLNKQHWYEILDNNTVAHDALGKPKSAFTKFPYDAAKALALMRPKNKEDSFILRIAKKEQNSTQKIHVYDVNLVNGEWKVFKKNITYEKVTLFTDK